jgi:hypothetical protein
MQSASAAETATAKAHSVGRWAETMFRALSSRHAKRWKFISFRGEGGGESRGVVDVLAIRKDTTAPTDVALKAYDLFDIVLVQCKGGGAAAPTKDDIKRLRRVAKVYRAKAIVLFEWKSGTSAALKKLAPRGFDWMESTGRDIFG